MSGNTMVISNFHDFYYLETLLAQMGMAKSANEYLQFKHSFVKLENDIKEEFARLTKTMALRIWVYLWSAALGEARHAIGYCDTWLAEISDVGRQQVYRKAHDYMPVGENLETLKGIYSQTWRTGGFGGKKWLQIVEGIEMYGEISDAAFIDHAADLEHNGGCVFNKDTSSYTNLYCYGEFGYETLKSFLDYKFKHDILNDYPDEFIRQAVSSHGYARIPVSRKVYTLIQRFSNVVKHVNILMCLNPVLETLSDYSVDWGTKTLTVDGKVKKESAKTIAKTNTTRLHVGDRVIPEYDGQFHAVGFARPDMFKYTGKPTKIVDTVKCSFGEIAYKIASDNGQWNWCAEWLHPVGVSTKSLSIGDTVKIVGYDGRSHGAGWVGGSMSKHVGKIAKVTDAKRPSYSSKGWMVHLDIDNGSYWWAWQWLEKVETDTTRKHERRERVYAHCAECGDELREDTAYFSSITSQDYCESCFSDLFDTCDRCNKEQYQDDLTQTPNHHIFYKLCDKCLDETMFQCPDCEEWYELNDGIYMEDTYEYKCESCSNGCYCRKCEEHYDDIEWHNRHEHKRR